MSMGSREEGGISATMAFSRDREGDAFLLWDSLLGGWAMEGFVILLDLLGPKQRGFWAAVAAEADLRGRPGGMVVVM